MQKNSLPATLGMEMQNGAPNRINQIASTSIIARDEVNAIIGKQTTSTVSQAPQTIIGCTDQLNKQKFNTLIKVCTVFFKPENFMLYALLQLENLTRN